MALAGECPPWSRNPHPSFDDRGNLVLLSTDWRTGGTIIDPESRCYRERLGVRNPERARSPVPTNDPPCPCHEVW